MGSENSLRDWATSLHGMKEFDIIGCEFGSQIEFIGFISSFPSLTSLDLRDIDVHQSWALENYHPDLNAIYPTPPLEFLDVRWVSDALLIPWLTESPAAVQELNLHLEYSERVVHINRLLETIDPALQTIRFNATYARGEGFISAIFLMVLMFTPEAGHGRPEMDVSLDLRHNTELRAIETPEELASIDCILSVTQWTISNLASPPLLKVSFYLIGGSFDSRDNAEDKGKWAMLDDIFSQHKFDGLKLLVWAFRQSDNKWLHQSLPRCSTKRRLYSHTD